MKSLFKPSYHSGQLSEMSLFWGQTFTPPSAFAATFHWQPSCRPSQWQNPHDFCASNPVVVLPEIGPSSAYAEVKNQRRPTSSSVANRFEPLPPFFGSGVFGVTPTARYPWRERLPFWSTPRNEMSSVCMLAT